MSPRKPAADPNATDTVRQPSRWGDALAGARRALASAGIANAALDARLLVADALGIDAMRLLTHGDEALGDEAASRLADHLRRRLAHEPVARILGLREFWGLPFRLSPDTLEPRADSETVVEAALAHVADREAPLRLLDLGTGTGCLLVALLHELPRARGIGIDRAIGAARTARLNAAVNGVGARASFLCGDWAEALEARFDIVVSNPPYIRTGLIERLAPEVAAYDPRLALDGGTDGLHAYRSILRELPRLLAAGGQAVLEIGFDQADALAALASDPLEVQGVRRDLAGQPRAVTIVPRRDLARKNSVPI